MSVNSKEALASLNILACVAMADGKIHDNERTALTVALESVARLEDATALNLQSVDQLLNNAKAERLPEYISMVSSPAARELAYNTAFAMANVDGDCDPTEQKILDILQHSFAILPRKTKNLLHILHNMRQSFHRASEVVPIADATARQLATAELSLHYATLCAMFWVFPTLNVAIAPDILVCTYQCQMIQEIAICWQFPPEQIDAYAILKGVISGMNIAGFRDPASNLTKMPPVGATIGGVANTYAYTWALGDSVNLYCSQLAQGQEVDMAMINQHFRSACERGMQLYKENANAVRQKMDSLK